MLVPQTGASIEYGAAEVTQYYWSRGASGSRNWDLCCQLNCAIAMDGDGKDMNEKINLITHGS